ncbi:MAG: GAF domain-containing protein, partial [Chloroflexi bacterium]|nr:GAF domain-containing protein [Chloroflexota bacterium]
VLNRAVETTQSHTGMLLLRTEGSDAPPSLVAHRGFKPGLFDRVSPFVETVAQTYRTGMPTVVADVAEKPDCTALDENTRSLLIVPIVRADEVLGVISLGSSRINDYSPDELSFVTQLATQARIAIDNARLFRRIEIARDRLQVILDSMKEAVILLEAEGWITLANPRVERLLGMDSLRIIKAPVVELIADPAIKLAERLGFTPEALLNALKSLSEGHWEESSSDGRRITFQLVTPAKKRFLDRTNAPVRNETGRVIGLLMVFTDVTEEHELAQAREDLGSMIVHDLRGPLTAVTTSLKLLNEVGTGDDAVGRMIRQTTEISSRAIRKLLNLVDSLLDISKLESGIFKLERELSKFDPLCLAVVDELSPLAQELDVKIEVKISENDSYLNIDGEKIERVVLNLVDNAIKFTPSGGQVIIATYAPGTAGAPMGFIRAEVRDTGPGIPDDQKERLFDRFAQIDGQRGRRRGTGLGLTFCRLAIEAHGGQIWIEDNAQGGAVFVFTLPVADITSLDLDE